MVTCQFKGRLGNILLSTYTCFWYAHQHNIPDSEVIFPRCYFRRIRGLDADPFTPSVDYLQQNITLLGNIWDHFVADPLYWTTFRERQPQLCSDLNSDLVNVFFPFPTWHLPQSPQDIALFRQLFPVSHTPVKQLNAQYFSDTLPNIAFHVRRTDYALHKRGKYWESEQQVQERLKYFTACNIVCFSDDPDWCQQQLVAPTDSQLTIKPVDWNEPACTDMMLMSCFDDISSTRHSTYSYCAKLLDPHITEIPTLD